MKVSLLFLTLNALWCASCGLVVGFAVGMGTYHYLLPKPLRQAVVAWWRGKRAR